MMCRQIQPCTLIELHHGLEQRHLNKCRGARMIAIRRLFASAQDVGAFLGILLRRLVGRQVTLIVGDSHAVLLGGRSLMSARRILRACDMESAYILWLGPKLLYSITRKGLPVWVRVLQSGALSRVGGSGVRLEMVLGEIDIRCHLASRLRLYGQGAVEKLGDDFVDFLRACSEIPGILEIKYHEPTPPSDLGIENRAFPRVGTLAERIRCHEVLSERIASGIATRFGNSSRVRFIPNPRGSVLADGSLNPSWTDDGCHFNRSIMAETNID